MNIKSLLLSLLILSAVYSGDWMWDQNGPIFELDTIVEYLEVPPCGDCCHACNVWLKSGGYTFTETDYSSKIYGTHIQIERTYNSLDKSSGLMGEGWTVSIGRNIMALTSQGDEFLVLRHKNGSEFKLVKEGEEYVYNGEIFWPYTIKESADKFVMQHKFNNYQRSIFNRDGQLLEVIDNVGNSTRYLYTKSGMLEEIKSDKRSVKINFGYNGKIQSITSTDDYDIYYTYNEFGQLTNVRQTYENKEISSINYEYSEYTYNDYTHTFMTSRTNENGAVIESVEYVRDVQEDLIEDNGDMVLYIYFAYKVDKMHSKGDTYQYGYYYDEMKTTVTNLAEETWTYFYDEFGVQTLEIGPDGKEVVREPSEHFDEDLNPKYSRIVDKNGGEHIFHYSETGQLLNYTDPLEDEYSYTYTSDGRVETITTPTGVVRTYTYNEQGNISSVKVSSNEQPLSRSGASSSLEKLWQYRWNDKGLVDTVIDPKNLITAFEYDSMGYVSAVTKPGGLRSEYTFNEKGFVTSFKGPDKHEWLYDYEIGSRWPTTVTDPLGNKTRYVYDKNGRIKRSTREDSSSVVSEYDEFGRLTKITDPLGRSTKYGYRTILKQDFLSSITYPNGQKSLFNYDGNGRITSKVLKVGDTLDEIDSDDIVTRLTYDDNGRLSMKQLPGGRPIFYSYDAKGRLKFQAFNRDTTRYEYFSTDKIKKIITSANNSYEMVYDKLGRLDTLKDDLGPIAKYTYDINDNVVSKEVFGADAATFEYNDAGKVSKKESKNGYSMEYVYDSTGQLSKVVDTLGNVIEYGYDNLGRITWQWPYKLDSLTYDTVKFSYNNMGKVESITNSSNISTKYKYDKAGNKKLEITDDKDTVEYTHDELDRVKTKKLPGGLVITFTYDGAGRLSERAYSDGTASDVYHYDKAGRMVHAANASADLSWGYDGEGNVVNHIINNFKSNTSGVDYVRDFKNNHDSITVYFGMAPASHFVYKKDKRDRLDSISTRDGHLLCSFEYEGMNLTKKHLGNGITTTMGYDSLGNRTSLSYSGGTEAILPSYLWGFDMEGRRTSTEKPHTPTKSQTYGYDFASQVNNVTQGVMDENRSIPNPLHEMDWVFDSEGNWDEFTVDGTVQTREHNWQNQITGIDGVSLEYDPRGNLTRDMGGKSLEWNGRNLLTSYNSDNTYDYDPLGRRVSKTVGGKTTSYVYDGWQVIAEFDTDGVTKRYVYGDYIDEPIAMITIKMDPSGDEIISSDTVYYLEGTNGNVAGVTSSTGELLEYYEYDAYGNKTIYTDNGGDDTWFSGDDVVSGTSSVGNSYFFQGRRFDDESGLYYFRNRYYSPDQGRFISKDPIGFKAGDYNFYRFVNNSSFDYSDPDGLEKLDNYIISNVEVHVGQEQLNKLLEDVIDKEIEPLFINANKNLISVVADPYQGADVKGIKEIPADGVVAFNEFEKAHNNSNTESIIELGAHGVKGYPQLQFPFYASGGDLSHNLWELSDIENLKNNLPNLNLVILGSCYSNDNGQWLQTYLDKRGVGTGDERFRLINDFTDIRKDGKINSAQLVILFGIEFNYKKMLWYRNKKELPIIKIYKQADILSE